VPGGFGRNQRLKITKMYVFSKKDVMKDVIIISSINTIIAAKFGSLGEKK